MKAVIFDFNGTLFFDSDKHEAAWKALALREFGRKMSAGEFRDHVLGKNNENILRYFIEDITPEQVRGYTLEKEALYRELCLEDMDHFHLAPGAEALLDRLKKAGVPMTIATGAEETNLAFYRERFRLDRWFDPDRIVYDDGTFPGKPFPDIYLRAAAVLNTAPEDCVVIEDSAAGVRSAKAAGIGRVIVIAPDGDFEAFADMKIDDKIRNFRELNF